VAVPGHAILIEDLTGKSHLTPVPISSRLDAKTMNLIGNGPRLVDSDPHYNPNLTRRGVVSIDPAESAFKIRAFKMLHATA
jgi:hypothetical protein